MGKITGTDINSLTHSKWRCQYHVVFAPKYRRQIIYGKIKEDIGKILRQSISVRLKTPAGNRPF